MGQGYSLTTVATGTAGIDVPELGDLVHEKSLGSARSMKSIRARHHDGVVLVKVLIKPYTPMPLDAYKKIILRERKILAGVPNALGYQRIVETETNGYLIRQFLYNSLYDRLSTRPFLEDIEKKWIAFQLLCALRDCHSRDVYHGDIKTENTLVTSWNWLYLSDFSGAFKPVMLPDDNPADFSYFFDTSGRRTCYIAPERFYAPGGEQPSNANVKLNWRMDVFSAGCVIAELFLETHIFSLSQMYSYREGRYNPAISKLGGIPDKELREMITHMIQLNPEKRYSAEQYLEFWKGKVFPEYFYSFLHQYMEVITDLSPGQPSASGAARDLGEADERIDRVYYDFDKITYFLGYRHDDKPSMIEPTAPRLGLGHFPVRLNIPNDEHYVSGDSPKPADNGTLIFLMLVVASLRNTARAASKIRACDILLAFAERLTDEAKLDRVLPYLISLLTDKSDMVVVAAIRTITQLLALVNTVSPVNSHIYLEYILPRMQMAVLGTSPPSSPLVRATYASCLGTLAESASRLLEVAATLGADGSLATADPEVESGTAPARAGFNSIFDAGRRDLILLFEQHTKLLIEDTDPYVRRAFLTSVPELCMFFGSAEANDIILTHLNTYLNNRDWMLKCAFFDTIVGIAAFLGSTSLEHFILPLMIQALTDQEEHVVQAAVHSLAEMAALGLFSKAATCELIRIIARFTMHPNVWIREAAAMFLSTGTEHVSPADKLCLLLPMIAPYLNPRVVPDFTELGFLENLKKPLSRSIFEQSLNWASKADRGVFWKSLDKVRGLNFSMLSSKVPGKSGSDSGPRSLSQVAKNEEDEQWMSRLRSLGLSQEDEFKLMALREFIWRVSRLKARDSAQSETNFHLNSIIPLRTLGITAQTVMFDDEPHRQPFGGLTIDDTPRSIEAALQDASMTIDDPISKRRRAALNTHRSRLNSRTEASPASPNRRGAQDEEALSPTTPDDSRRSSTAIVGDGSGAEVSLLAKKGALRHQSSAMSLMGRKSSVKTGPEIGMTEANATGRVDNSFAPSPLARSPLEQPDGIEGGLRPRASHTYEGHDPSVLKMLDAMYFDNFPHDLAEFGPYVAPISRRKAGKPASQGTQEPWKPAGRLVATLSEHKGAINRVVASPDHAFFLTGGDDSCVRVWDSMRLERNVTHRSRQTHRHAPEARVLSLCFIENTYCFISCASDGSVHVVKVECSPGAAGVMRYNKLRLLREYQLPTGEFAVWSEHYKQEANSVLILATNRSRVLGIDLRTMALLFVLENPVHHGTPTCFAIDRKRNWLVLSTSHGVLDLWDLRFRMRLKAWGVPGKNAIYRLAIHPVKGRGRWLCVAGGTGQGEVTVWDIEKTLCREVYRVAGNKETPKGYEPWEVDEDRPEGMLGRFATAIEPSSHSSSPDRGVRAMVTGSTTADDGRDVRYAYIVTGGSDKKLRFWDLTRIENSTVFSGLAPDEGRPTYSANQITTALVLNTERLARVVPSVASSANGERGTTRSTQRRGSGGSSSTGSAAKPGRSTVISMQQQQLLRSHLDAILDVTLLEHPYTMSVSVDRSGCVFVFS